MRHRSWWWLCAGVCLLVTCAKSPQPEPQDPSHWALGIARPMSESSDISDVIPFRQLSRADFRATNPPPGFAPHRARIRAVTCGYIGFSPGTQIEVRRQGDGRFVATVRALRFRAVMNRGCSWWNEENDLAEETVLEHEQVHFSLLELGARGMNARAPVLEDEARAIADDPETAARELQDRLRMMLKQATLDVLRRGSDFDRATSLRYDPVRQREWAEQVVRELAETEALATPAGVGGGSP